jgi:PhnB protein
MRRSDNIVPELCVHDGVAALEFYKQAFRAVEQKRMMSPDGAKLLYAELTVGGHRLVVFDEFSASEGGTLRCPRTLEGSGIRLILQVDDADAVVHQAVAAGAVVMMPVTEMFWGARYGKLKDPYGHEWGINEQLEELPVAEEARRAEQFLGKPPTKFD